ncbi:MAG TPA: carboxypeptidase-like regulatory domain-containing protein [Pirellulaceae bacterium]|nr:carboxypeptidase-like regulatory domain-containing protein [Pirellulaceae bacterium]
MHRAIWLIASVLFAGCGPGLVPVEGRVLLEDQPLADAQVLFLPKSGGRPATGKTNAEGQFTLTTNRPSDGVRPGEYQVAVTALQVLYVRPTDGSEYAEQKVWIAPERYSKPAESGLAATISPEANRPTFELRAK